MSNISVVIPVKNEAKKIRACIDGILSQTVKVKKIIVVDSGSTDGTLDILKSYSEVQIIEIPPDSFNHGETRNLGVSHVDTEYVLLTVGDARPFNNTWIENMLNGFVDEEVVAVCGKQVVPHDKDKNPLDWYRPVSKGEIRRIQYAEGAFDALSPSEKKNACGWDDVTAMYRTEVLKALPFRRTSYSEDAIWAKDALTNGHALVYNPEAMVYHYHIEDKDFTFKRSLTTFYFRYKHFNYLYPSIKRSFIDMLRNYTTIFTSDGLTLKEKLYWIKYNNQNFNALKEAYKVFMAALNVGEEQLDFVHNKFCGKPPIPAKN